MPPINQAVFEYTENTIMTCNSTLKVSWNVTPTDNELFPTQITNYSDMVVPTLTGLYDVMQTNLTIKTAQSSPVVQMFTTSGIYVAQYAAFNATRIGAKLVVVRK